MNKKQNKKYIVETPLNDYERKLQEFLNKGEYISAGNFKQTKKMFEEAAKRHIELQKTKRITLRVKNEDLVKVKVEAPRAKSPRILRPSLHHS